MKACMKLFQMVPKPRVPDAGTVSYTLRNDAVDDIKADILARFRDSGDKKSKAYEFGALSLTIARELSRGTMTADNAWASELRDIVQAADSCLEDGIQFLADRFHSVAQNVAGLARHFKGEKEKKPKAIDFMKSLDSLIEKTIDDGQSVPVSAAMDSLIVCGDVAPIDANRIMGRLVKAYDAVSLVALIDHLNDVLSQRLDVERKAAELAEAA
jgi:hypothetical protein